MFIKHCYSTPLSLTERTVCFVYSSWCAGGNINLGKKISPPAPHNKIRHHSVCQL